MAENETRVKYLIIGNSAGSTGAAEAIRAVDGRGALAVVSEEPYPVYSRPLIAEYLAEKCSLERMLFRPADFYEKNRIQTFFGKKAERLDLSGNAVTLDSGEVIRWQKLLLATGGIPIFPPMKGGDHEGVFTFTCLDDAKAIDRYLKGDDRVVVIGGGLIGMSVTEAMLKRGAEITVVEMKDWILNVMLDEKASAMVTERLEELGVRLVTGHTVVSINAEGGAIHSVTLDDGSELPCRMVIVAIGVRPCIGLVEGTGIKVNRGIVVDRHMETSAPGVYACGDAAEAYDFIYDECRLTPIWPNAYQGGKDGRLQYGRKNGGIPGRDGDELAELLRHGRYVGGYGQSARWQL